MHGWFSMVLVDVTALSEATIGTFGTCDCGGRRGSDAGGTITWWDSLDSMRLERGKDAADKSSKRAGKGAGGFDRVSNEGH